MGRQIKNYRKIYEKYFDIKIPKDYEIHHIDFNHENNDIDNLIMLPRELHQAYHKAIYELAGLENGHLATIDGIINIHGGSFLAEEMINFCNILIEIDKWVLHRENLDFNQMYRRYQEEKQCQYSE